jgi:hypothetical protein
MAIQRRGLLWESTVDLTAAQIKTWHSAPIEAAPAPGANRIIAPLRYALLMAPGTVGFSAVQGAAVELDLTCNGVTLDSYSGVQNVLGQTTAKGSLFAASTNQAVTLATLSNQALTATLDRDLTAGGVATATLNAAGLGYAANDTGPLTPTTMAAPPIACSRSARSAWSSRLASPPPGMGMWSPTDWIRMRAAAARDSRSTSPALRKAMGRYG